MSPRKRQDFIPRAAAAAVSVEARRPLTVFADAAEDAAFAQRTGVMQQQPGVHTISVVLMETRQHPQTLVVVEWLQTDGTVVCFPRLGRVTPWLGLTICFGLQGRHSLQDILFRKELQVIVQLVVLVLPASLNDDAGAEDQSHQENSVPQLLQVFLNLRVGLSRADDPLPLSIATSSRSTAAGPQRERGSLPEHTAACAHCQLSLSPVHSPLEGANN